MTVNNTHIVGSPYFPGVVVGKLRKGMHDDVNGYIVMCSQDELSSFAALPAGFIVVDAAPFSHRMIGLLGLGVPTVLINEHQAAMIEEGMELLIDGTNGRITGDLDIASPVTEIKSDLQAGQAVLMADGEPVTLSVSVRQPSAARKAKALGAKDIGLVRSEFLLPADDRVPDADFYRDAFREICEAASPLTVTFRLLDVAADKIPTWLPASDSQDQSSGLQGVRLYNIDPVQNVIDAQLDALADLSSDYSVRVLVPFLTRLEEYDYWSSLVRKRVPNVSVGAMAETPASVLDIAHLLEQADFVSIGCNDLMQSLYAADRDRSELRYYLDPYAPVLFRLFEQVAEQSAQHLDQIQLCGVLPQIRGVLPVLLGLGYQSFSVDAPFIPYIANIVANTTHDECKALAEQVCATRTTQQVLEILQLPTDHHPPFAI